ncbi:MAG: sugar porter family MFS transporter [Kordiimonadaceae bacterium]|nr:sugar porter family MFS transporter [Kordiimonadaceae bacterium]
MRYNYLIKSALIAALGGLLFGFDTAVISGTTSALEEVYGLSKFSLGLTVAVALIGTIIGALVAAKPADIYGRKNMLFIISAVYFVSAIGSAFAWDWYSFVIFRLIGGLGVGAASVVSPLYIAEISPAHMRGRLVAFTQFNIVLGLLLAFASNYYISSLDLGAVEWRWMFGVEAVPAALFFVLLFLTPYSPRWLVRQNRTQEAQATLGKLGLDDQEAMDQIEDIKQSIDTQHHDLQEPLFQRAYTKPIMLAFAIAMFNQLSGINALMYYAPTIFKMAGSGEESALLQTVGVGVINLFFTMMAMTVIDRFGRRTLMLVCSFGYIISLSVVAWAFFTYGDDFAGGRPSEGGIIVLISLGVFIASHAFGQGAVIWVFLSEIFPNRVRAKGQAFGSFVHWFMAAAISWTFPIIAEISGGYTFAFYAVMMVVQLFWVIKIMPETKGVSLENIQKKLGIT